MSDEDRVTKGAVKKKIQSLGLDGSKWRNKNKTSAWIGRTGYLVTPKSSVIFNAALDEACEAIDQLPAVEDRRRSEKEIERVRDYLAKKKDYGAMARSGVLDLLNYVLGEENEWSQLFAEQKGEGDGD